MTRSEAIAKIEAEYAKRRDENSAQLDARIAKARETSPEIGTLLDLMAKRFVQSTRQVLENKTRASEIAAKLKSDNLRDRARVRELLKSSGFPDDFLDRKYRCADCGDTGYVDQAHIKKCHCFENRLNEMLYGDDVSQNRFERFNADIYPSESQRQDGIRAKDICLKFADDYPNQKKHNLLLVGKSGLGKTFFLDSIYHRVIDNGIPALRVTAFRMLEAMRAYHFGDVGDDSQLNALIASPFLLVDDLGTEPMLKNITNEYLFLLVNERLYARKTTVYATNLTPKQIEDRYSERVSSRLLGRQESECILLVGQDLRLKGNQ